MRRILHFLRGTKSNTLSSFPFFGYLFGFFGGFGFAPTSYFLPSVIWLIIKKPIKFSISWLVNCVIILIRMGVLCSFETAYMLFCDGLHSWPNIDGTMPCFKLK